MRMRILAIAAAVGVLCVPGLASATPAVLAPVQTGISHRPEFLPVRDGCGPGFYLARWQDRWGRWHRRCVPFRGWGGPHWRPGWGGYYR